MEILTSQDGRPVLDERGFGQLLAAAYVIQLENERSQSQAEPEEALGESDSHKERDYTQVLAHIVETQHQIQTRHLNLTEAMALIAERAARITGASSAAIGTLEGQAFTYRAGTGAAASEVDTEIAVGGCLSTVPLRLGSVMNCPDVAAEPLFNAESCRQRGIASLLAVPIFHNGSVAGALELRGDKPNAFDPQDVHTAQLMAGQVSETLARSAELEWKKTLAEERATIFEALEKLRPQLAQLVEEQQGSPDTPAESSAAGSALEGTTCTQCGRELAAEEQFCGTCGSPRGGGPEEATIIPHELASSQQQENGEEVPSPVGSVEDFTGVEKPLSPADEDRAAESETIDLAKLAREPEDDEEEEFDEPQDAPPENTAMVHSPAEWPDADLEQLEDHSTQELPATVPDAGDTWHSAAKAWAWWERVRASQTSNSFAQFWRARRGDFYLGAAVIVLLVAIRWGFWSGNAAGAAASVSSVTTAAGTRYVRSRRPPEVQLTAFEKMLVSLGLAEAPPPPTDVYSGNPATQVWVDLHTALYYCPGSELYGKTPKGKFTSQRDAQLDQFEPASRKACD